MSKVKTETTEISPVTNVVINNFENANKSAKKNIYNIKK